jgi:hypothetical protein
MSLISGERQYDIDKAGISVRMGDDEMAELFMNDRKEFIHRYHNGWRVLEKDNPETLKEIDEQENHDLKEFKL